MGGASGDGRKGGVGGLAKEGGGGGLGKEREEAGQEEGGQISQVRNEEQRRESFCHNQRKSLEERSGRQGGGGVADFSRPSGFLAMPSAPSAQVPL